MFLFIFVTFSEVLLTSTIAWFVVIGCAGKKQAPPPPPPAGGGGTAKAPQKAGTPANNGKSGMKPPTNANDKKDDKPASTKEVKQTMVTEDPDLKSREDYGVQPTEDAEAKKAEGEPNKAETPK